MRIKCVNYDRSSEVSEIHNIRLAYEEDTKLFCFIFLTTDGRIGIIPSYLEDNSKLNNILNTILKDGYYDFHNELFATVDWVLPNRDLLDDLSYNVQHEEYSDEYLDEYFDEYIDEEFGNNIISFPIKNTET